jgi:hypothetical protein
MQKYVKLSFKCSMNKVTHLASWCHLSARDTAFFVYIYWLIWNRDLYFINFNSAQTGPYSYNYRQSFLTWISSKEVVKNSSTCHRYPDICLLLCGQLRVWVWVSRICMFWGRCLYNGAPVYLTETINMPGLVSYRSCVPYILNQQEEANHDP